MISFQDAVNNACEHLPDLYKIEISLEREAGWITLWLDGDDITSDLNLSDLDLIEQIQECVRHARELTS